MKNEIQITQTINKTEGLLEIGFIQTPEANDYYFIWNDVVEGPYADEGEAFGGWYRAQA